MKLLHSDKAYARTPTWWTTLQNNREWYSSLVKRTLAARDSEMYELLSSRCCIRRFFAKRRRIPGENTQPASHPHTSDVPESLGRQTLRYSFCLCLLWKTATLLPMNPTRNVPSYARMFLKHDWNFAIGFFVKATVFHVRIFLQTITKISKTFANTWDVFVWNSEV